LKTEFPIIVVGGKRNDWLEEMGILRIVGIMAMTLGWAFFTKTLMASPAPNATPNKSAAVNGTAVQRRSPVNAEARIHAHDPMRLHWQLRDPSLPENVADSPASFNAGSAVWLTLSAPVILAPAAAESQDVIFYHSDHLGSATVMTDRDGALVQETAYYPFGDVRHSHEPIIVTRPPYGFTEKEQDAESNLQYFEARYRAGMLARFISPDPKFANPAMLPSGELAAFLSRPQKGNAYAYALNNPLVNTDPTGLDEETQVARAVVEGIRQVNAKTGAFKEVIKTYETPAVHWIFVDDQSTVKLENDRPPRWSDGGRRYAPARLNGRPEDLIKPQYSFPDADEWETLPKSDKAAHEDAFARAEDLAVEQYREIEVAGERLRESLEKENRFLPLMD